MELVSVIVPTYNDEQYIAECLRSIINQTYPNIEIIVIDDGSADRTASVVNKFSDRVKYIYQENQGPSVARNTGLNIATGCYLAFVDADDLIDKTMIAKLVSEIELNSADIAICGMNQFTRINDRVKIIAAYPGKTSLVIGNDRIFESLYPYFNTEKLNPPYGRIYRLELLRKMNLQFDSSLSLGEDFIFNLEYFSKITRFCSLGEALYQYRRGNNYLTLKYSGEFNSNKKLMFTRAKQVLIKYNLSECFFNEQFLITCFSYFMELPTRFPSDSYRLKRGLINHLLHDDDVQNATNNITNIRIKLLAIIIKIKNPEIVYLSSKILNTIKKFINLRY